MWRNLVKKPDLFITQVISGNRVTILEAYRKVWGIQEGDSVELKIVSIIKKKGAS